MHTGSRLPGRSVRTTWRTTRTTRPTRTTGAAHTIRATLTAIALLAAGASAPAFGQAAAPVKEPPPRLEAAGQFTLLATSGNSSTQSLGVGGEMAWRPDPWVYTGRIIFAQNEDQETLKARSFVGLFRAARALTPRLSLYGQYDYLRDIFAGIEHRNTTEGGLSYLAVDQDRHRLRLDGALGYQRETRFDADDLSTAIALGGVGYRLKLSETSEFIDEARLILTLADMDAWKLDQVASLTTAIASIFSLKVSNTIRFAHEPVPGFKQTDTITSVAIVVAVKRPARPAVP